MKNLTLLLLTITEKIKPLLVKFLPISLLRRVKKSLVNYYMNKLSRETKRAFFPRSANADGINLIGYIQGEIGLGQSCRLLAKSIEHAKIDYTIYNYDQVSAMRFNDKSLSHKISNTTPYNINLIHIAPYEIPLAYYRLGRSLWDNRYNIAYWLWELENFPPEWENALTLADEIWTPSEFASASIRKITKKPVCTIPYAFSELAPQKYSRKHFDIPDDKFLFLVMYDCNSTMERKNPIGAINAFKQAFDTKDTNVGIVIKVNNPQSKDIEIIKKELANYPCVYILADVLDKEEVNSLIACVDVYVSLHRAEGFGLVPVEAMLLGTPVISTAWSSVTEFMNNDVACMVDYEFTEIIKDCGPYKSGNRWADPNIMQAAKYMQQLYTNKDLRITLANKAKTHILEHFSPNKIAALIQNRMSEIYKGSET